MLRDGAEMRAFSLYDGGSREMPLLAGRGGRYLEVAPIALVAVYRGENIDILVAPTDQCILDGLDDHLIAL